MNIEEALEKVRDAELDDEMLLRRYGVLEVLLWEVAPAFRRQFGEDVVIGLHIAFAMMQNGLPDDVQRIYGTNPPGR